MDWEQHYRQLSRVYSTEYPRGSGVAVGGFFDDTWDALTTPIEEQVANYTLLKDDLNATNRYIHSQPIKTTEAGRIASDWARWWDTTGNPENYSIKIPPEVWDEARNRKLKFNIANAVSTAEKEQVLYVAKNGMSSEQMRGQEDRRDPGLTLDSATTTGAYYVPPPPEPSVLPPWAKPVFVGALALGLGLSAVPMLRKFVFHV
jgi:hypothetical protein